VSLLHQPLCQHGGFVMRLSPFLRGALANCSIGLAPTVQGAVSVESGLRLSAG